MSVSWQQRAEFAQAALFATDRIHNGAIFPVWIDDEHFWYERQGNDGVEYAVVAAATGERRATLPRAMLADALTEHLNAPVDRDLLIVRDPIFDMAAYLVSFTAYGESYSYSWLNSELKLADRKGDRNWIASPDRTAALLMVGNDLELLDLATGKTRPLTTDGTIEHAYASPPMAMRILNQSRGADTPEALWSPDSRWILTLQTDERHVPDLPLAEYAPAGSVRPIIHSNRTSLPADPKVTEFRMVAIEAETGRQVEARYPRLTAVRMNSTPLGAGLAWWGADSQTAYFVDIERGEQRAHVVAFDIETGATRIIFTEESSSYVEVSANVYSKALIAPLPATDELVWYSERTGRGHLYLYDLTAGDLRCAITAGDWQVRDVLRVDAARREIFILAAGISPEENPYVVKPCNVSLDGAVTVLSETPGDHLVWRPGSLSLMAKTLEGLDPERISGLSPGGKYFVETVSTVTELPTTVLRDRDGLTIATLEEASGELPEGWLHPEPLECLAADGVTTTYGLLFKPFGYEPGNRYPLIDVIYGGAQLNNVPQSSFADGGSGANTYIDAVHLASLGAWVLVLDGRGTANREQKFRTTSYRAVHTASDIQDHIAAIRQLSLSNADIDLARVGITGFSGGGYMAAHAALRIGEFFQVAVGGGGNYDQALFWHSWGERYHGAYELDHYAAQAAKTYAAGMAGKLMLVHGMLDSGCHPAAFFQLVQALIEADKDPDLVVLPRGHHDWTGYGLRRRWEYFVTHLLGEEPPMQKSFERPYDRLSSRFAADANMSKKAQA